MTSNELLVFYLFSTLRWNDLKNAPFPIVCAKKVKHALISIRHN